MWRWTHFFLIIVLSNLVACNSETPEPVKVKITLQIPGEPATEMDAYAAKVINCIDDAEEVIAISMPEKSDVYFTFSKKPKMGLIRTQLDRLLLPEDSEPFHVEIMSAESEIPTPPKGMVEELDIRLNVNAIQERYDLKTVDVARAIRAMEETGKFKNKQPHEVKELTLPINGKQYRIDQLAFVSMVNHPKAIVRDRHGKK